MSRKGKLPPSRDRQSTMCYRAGAMTGAKTADDESRSVRMVLASENPVQVLDFNRMEIVSEVLLMEGLSTPAQLPLLNSHNRFDLRDVIGSIRDLEKRGKNLEGTAFFADNEEGQHAYEMFRDGHLTDFSIGFGPSKTRFIEKGQTHRVGDREFKGPMRLVEKSKAVEGSAVAIGADSHAKARQIDGDVALTLRAYTSPESLLEEFEMPILEIARKLGMPAELTGDEAEQWIAENLVLRTAVADPPKVVPSKVVPPVVVPPVVVLPAVVPNAMQNERERTAAIIAMCDQHNRPIAERNAYIASDDTPDQVARALLGIIHSQPGTPVGVSPSIVPGESEADKFVAAVGDAFIGRAVSQRNLDNALMQARGTFQCGPTFVNAPNAINNDAITRNEELIARVRKPSAGAQDFRYASIYDIACAFLSRANQRIDGLPRSEVFSRAIAHPGLTIRASDGAAFSSSGSFTNLLLDAANKTLLAAYDEALVTYPIWARQAASVSDFKNINRIRFGELPDPEVVPENGDYKDVRPTDAKESYQVEKHGQIFSITLEAMVNDDMDAISRIPAMQGAAMRRSINRTVYSILTANANLSDGIAIFHATSHNANLDTTTLAAGAPLNVGHVVMMTQSGLESTTILNIVPRFLIVPAALSATALQITRSMGDPAVGGDVTGHEGVSNLYGPGGPRNLTVVIDGQLDGNSATAWYLAADTSQVDTVEYTFLQGEEAPFTSREEAFTSDAIKYKIRQTFAAKAIDFRGLYQGNT